MPATRRPGRRAPASSTSSTDNHPVFVFPKKRTTRMLIDFLAAAGGDAPQNKFGFMEAMQQGGVIAWFILSVLVIMSVGSFYILITKLLEQNKIMSQYKTIRGGAFW